MIHLICFVNRKCNLFLKCQQMMLILPTDFAPVLRQGTAKDRMLITIHSIGF